MRICTEIRKYVTRGAQCAPPLVLIGLKTRLTAEGLEIRLDDASDQFNDMSHGMIHMCICTLREKNSKNGRASNSAPALSANIEETTEKSNLPGFSY